MQNPWHAPPCCFQRYFEGLVSQMRGSHYCLDGGWGWDVPKGGGWIEQIKGGCWKGWVVWIITTYHAMIIGIRESRPCIMISMFWLRMWGQHRTVSIGWRVCGVVLLGNVWHWYIGSRSWHVPASMWTLYCMWLSPWPTLGCWGYGGRMPGPRSSSRCRSGCCSRWGVKGLVPS